MAYKWVLFFFLSFTAIQSSIGEESCKDINNGNVRCLQSYNPLKCPEGSIYSSKSALSQCCPGCVVYKKLDETCSGDSGDRVFDFTIYFTPKKSISLPSPPIVESGQCAPGLKCISSKCQYPDNNPPSNCMNDAVWSGKSWRPLCDPDGSYAPVQCKDNGHLPRCFCSARDGRRLFGWDFFENGDQMGCLCSRMDDELKRRNDKYGDLVFHCSPNGNFEPLQCNNGLCYCVDSASGQPMSSFVHHTMWQTLPCYDRSMGDQFLRICNSQSVAAHDMKKELSLHGSQGGPTTPPCDPDGSYSAKQCDRASRCTCNTKDNNYIKAYAAEKGTIPEAEMNCNCARDEVIYAELGIPFILECDGIGNYKRNQTQDNPNGCLVDPDGFYEQNC